MNIKHLIAVLVLMLITANISAQDKRIIEDYNLEMVQDVLLSDYEIFRPTSSIDMTEEGKIIFFDFARFELVVYDMQAGNFQFIGNRGRGPKEFGQIFDLKIDGNDHVFLIDTGNNKIVKWHVEGEYIGEMSVGSRFIRPARFALCEESDIMYILSSQYGRDGILHQYHKNGALNQSFHKIKKQEERLVYYTDGTLACDENENLYYATRYVNKIKKYNKEGKLIYSIPVYDSEPNEEMLRVNGRYTSLNPSAIRYTSNIYYLDGKLYVSYSGLPKNYRYRFIDVYLESQQEYLHSIQLPYEFRSFVMTKNRIAIIREDETEEMYLTIYKYKHND